MWFEGKLLNLLELEFHSLPNPDLVLYINQADWMDASTSPSSSSDSSKSTPRRSYLSALVQTQQTTGLVFSSFLFLHLLPPSIVAITGNESSGSGFMVVRLPPSPHLILYPRLLPTQSDLSRSSQLEARKSSLPLPSPLPPPLPLPLNPSPLLRPP